MPVLPEYVRVRLANGTHATVTTAVAEAANLKPLKQDALRRDGTVRPPKHRVSLGGAGSAATTNNTTEAADASESKED